MRWELLGWCALALWCAACGESSGKTPSTAAAAGAGASSAGNSAGGSNSNAGAAGIPAAGASVGGGAGVGLCRGTTNQTGGTRLKSKFWITAEGDRAWDSLWDSELNVPCEFGPTTDGKLRCLPNIYDFSEEVFSDAACTQPLYTRMRVERCTYADYIMQYVPSTGCGTVSGYAFYKLGAQVTTPATVYINAVGSGCVAGIVPEQPLYAKGLEMPPETFLEGTRMVFEAATRVRTEGVSASDGTRLVSGWADKQLDDESCAFGDAEDGQVRCLPRGGGLVSTYADSMCMTPLAVAALDCNQRLPKYAVQAPANQCYENPYTILKVGEAFTGTPHIGTPDNCTLATIAAGSAAYVTTPAPLDMFQAVNETIDQTDPGRLKPRYYDAGANGCWFHSFWDSELKTPCSFAQTTDMKERCIPSTRLRTTELFSDEACTVSAIWAPIDACTPAELPKLTTRYTSDCPELAQVWKVGDAVQRADLPPLWSLDTGVCAPAMPMEDKFLRLTPVDAGQFMAAEQHIE